MSEDLLLVISYQCPGATIWSQVTGVALGRKWPSQKDSLIGLWNCVVQRIKFDRWRLGAAKASEHMGSVLQSYVVGLLPSHESTIRQEAKYCHR